MDKIVDYRILTGFNPLVLASTVQRMMEHGWQPLGGIGSDGRGEYAQAVVKYGN